MIVNSPFLTKMLSLITYLNRTSLFFQLQNFEAPINNLKLAMDENFLVAYIHDADPSKKSFSIESSVIYFQG